MDGWIKLHRKSRESVVFQSANLWKVWCWCLIRATHKRRKILFAGKEIELKPGQFITGRFQGAEECNMKPGTFKDQIYKLEKLKNIDTKSDNRKTLITIVNWEEYQHLELQSDSSSDNYPTSTRQLSDTNKNERIKEEVLTLFEYWNELKIIEHRKLTDKTKRKINGSLKDYSIDEIKSSINNYKLILESPLFFFNYKWTLADFLQRGLEKFLDLETAKNNYKKETIQNNGHKPKEAVTELVI